MSAGTTVQAAVQRYLQERRQLGFALKAPGTELLRFARFADTRCHQGETVTSEARRGLDKRICRLWCPPFAGR